jgi:hypothetical protein
MEKKQKQHYNKILSVCRFWDMEFGSPGKDSLSEIFTNKILELHSDELPSVTTKNEKIEIIFGTLEESYKVEIRVNLFLENYLETLVSEMTFPYFNKEEKRMKLFLNIVIDYYFSKYCGWKKNKSGKFGMTYEEIESVESFLEKTFK